ncbi:MAG TPA: SDR family oxidoreductase [Humisphaera sp.]|jgi:2-hydroxycyclohexanecarboxyl-CoA dehydrogenase|nr:SDR family oxidoreductase [Humisphaera sp.]
MDLNLKGDVVVVTGGASGIGRATALAFAAEGARVAIWDLEQSAEDNSTAIKVDITEEAAIAGALARTVESLGPVDHLVHAAAIGSGKFGFPFTNLEPADWPRVLKVNVMGMVNVAHAVAPRMTERGKGTMVFVSSVAGQIGSQTDPPYSASKAANINFAQCMAKDLAPRGVRVNCVCPGMVQTPLNRAVWQAWHDHAPPEQRLSYEQWSANKIRTVVPLGRWQTPEAIADMIVFLSSERAAHVTGQTINVDGGFVMHW